jgi:DNA-directed RNA polymerase subunit F
MLTRKILNVVSKFHATRLVGLVDKAEKAEQRAGVAVELAERFSRWANEKKKEARSDLVRAVAHADVVAEAVAAELDTLPALTDDAVRLVRGQ